MEQAHSAPLRTEDGEALAAQPPLGGFEQPAVRFDLRLLESFVTLASELHFGRAARRLSFAQPALSQQIRRLETQVGSALFIRDSRKVELTAAGTAFLAHASISLAAAVDAGEAAAATERAMSGRLPLSVNGDALEHTRALLRAFTRAHPEVQLDVSLQFDNESSVALSRHAVDASILWATDGPPRGFENTSALLCTPGAGIAMRSSHPLAAPDAVSVDGLEGQRLIMFPRERAAEFYDDVLDHLGGASRFSSIHHITTMGPAVAADVLGALDDESVAPFPLWQGLEQAPRGLVCTPMSPDLPLTLWLVWTGAATKPTRALANFTSRTNTARRPEQALSLVPQVR